MRSHSSHVRIKVVALLVSMTALWVFAAAVTLREGLNLLFVNTLTNEVGKPTESLLEALQSERKLSVMVLSGDPRRQALVTARAHTDETVAAWRGHVNSGEFGLELAFTDLLRSRIDEANLELDRLGQVREDVDSAGMSRTEAVGAFTTMIDAGFGIYGSISSFDDEDIAKQARTLIALSRARELVAQEDSLLTGVLVDGEFSGQDIAEFSKLVGAQRFLYASTSIDLPPVDLAEYEAVSTGTTITRLRLLEDEVIARAQPGAAPPFDAATWQSAVGPALTELRDLELSAADHTVENAIPAAVGVMTRLALAGGLGLIAVIAAIIVSITTARRLVRQLERLREAARDLATNRLPDVVKRLSVGETVDVATDAPALDFGNDEIGQVGQAFNAVQDTAVRAAVQQAELRHGVRDVFLSLARRTQNLVHKQLSVLDAMERRQTDADEMEDLFKIDHLATRMRRNAENLIVLSGATPGRTWRRAVPMVDVVRGALGEVEDYTRVTLLPVESAALVGRAVGDVIHLLAELIENAVSYSPPYAQVNVVGQRVANGFVVEIEDRGLGMSDEDLSLANRQLAEPPDFSLADTSRLGHYVVGKLAERHGISVHLRHSPYGGTVAIVLIPSALMVELSQPEQVPVAAGPATMAAPAGRREVPPAELPQRGESRQAPIELPQRQITQLSATPAPPPPAPAPAPSAPPATKPSTDSDGVDPGRTPSGLPWRVRQASLVHQLKQDPTDELGTSAGNASPESAGSAWPADEPEQLLRDPEQVRQMMRSYQHGTLRGRTEAADESSTSTESTHGTGPSHAAGRLNGFAADNDPAEAGDGPRHASEQPGDRQKG